MKSRVYSNTIALVFVQLANYLSPLLVIPFLTRTFGPEGFGELALIFSIMAIFLIFTDYGFNIVSPYKIAKRQSDKNYISIYVSNVILAKLFIYLLCGFVLAVVCLFTNVIKVGLDVYLYILLGVFFQSIQLNWFYQGIENLKILTLATVFGKVFYLISVILLVADSNKSLVVFLYSISFGVSSACLWFWYFKNDYHFYIKGWRGSVLKEASEFFISRAFVALYTSFNTFIIGSQAGYLQAGYYSSAEKIYQAGQSCSMPITQAIFPYLSKTKDKKLFLRMFFSVLLLVLAVGLLAFYYSNYIISFLFGQDFLAANSILRVFIIAGMVNFVGSFWGYPAFSLIDRLDIANKSVMVGGFIHAVILICLFLTANLNAINVVFSVLSVEFIVMLIRIFSFYKLRKR
ncbi:oligosaccharide flippase family protein [Vibrio vulnificus]|uniref:oligosaccharide flippase family protein n=1 Tax=Vibrio vulnificus TaxID=672 RepID=UPI0009B6E6DB|nr:oligosaccharide flippase family protein [Vibrio vulnificus]ELP5903114.1 oligosaccharide flippase family protein [Vibrio vulnificus]MCU8465653.1 oligosaccharide flippase family protein [Vibrio vulnificus]OQK43042.1 putative membrane protein [Vibrio vulnificus]HAS8569990.1 hypothetical protein [Vibrio vulnificus]